MINLNNKTVVATEFLGKNIFEGRLNSILTWIKKNQVDLRMQLYELKQLSKNTF